MSSQLSSQKKPTRLRDVFAQAMVLLNKSQRTVKIYTEAMLRFCAFLQGMHPLKVSVNDIRAFLFYCKEERGFSPKYYNQTFYGLKMFYGIFLPDVPLMEQFCRIRTKENDIVILTRAEIEKMIRITDNLKHQAMIELLYSTGMRVSELAELRFEHIDRSQGFITVRGKGDKQRYVPLSQRCVGTLKKYYRAFKPQGWVIPGQNQKRKIAPNTIEHAVRTAAQRAGIKKKCSPRRNRLPASGCDRRRHTHTASAVAPLPTQSFALAGTLFYAPYLCYTSSGDRWTAPGSAGHAGTCASYGLPTN